jgi:hypothetical protein
MSHIGSLPRAILDLEKREKESIGIAWAKFSTLLYASPDLSLPDGVILCLFCTSLDIDADLCLDMTTGGRFTHKTMTEQVEFLERFIAKHTSFVIRIKLLQAKVMLSVEESSVVTKHIPFLGSTCEPHPNHEHQRKQCFILWSSLSNSRILVIPQNTFGTILTRKFPPRKNHQGND